MPLHQNQDGTWQWGKSGKKYKKKEDAIKQMKAIFANGYVEKHASLNDSLFTDINYKGNSYMTYTDVYRMLKQAALTRTTTPVNRMKTPISTAVKKAPAISSSENVPGGHYDPRYRIKSGDTAWSLWKMVGGNKYMPWQQFQQELINDNSHIKDINKLSIGTPVNLRSVVDH